MLQETKTASGVPNTNPVFVIGIIRSGTTLLYALLNQHPQIALMFECGVLNFPKVFSKMRFKGNWLERQEFYNKALSRHHLIFGNRLSGLEGVRTPDDLYRAYSDGKKAAYFGEKAPSYCPRLRQLAGCYPGASFILLWRDPFEAYRSIERTGRKVAFFRRFGINRFIFFQEQMIRQAAELEFAGAKMHHVSYDDLVDKTEESCRSLCRFLNIEFDPVMVNLAEADLSATHDDGNRRHVHDQMMRGIIKRRKYSEDGLTPEIVQKLQRFHARWHRLGGHRLPQPVSETEPFLGERLYHGMAGRILFLADNGRRALLEFLPLNWLKAYRRTKNWFRKGGAAGPGSLAEEFSANRVTILAGFMMLATAVTVDLMTPPQTVLIPFYLIPSAFLALTIDRRWGSLAAVVSALAWTAAKIPEQPEWNSHCGLLLWNCTMRFLALQIIVLLLNRVRLEIASTDYD